VQSERVALLHRADAVRLLTLRGSGLAVSARPSLRLPDEAGRHAHSARQYVHLQRANLTGRLVTWVSTNSRVVSVTASSGSPDA